MSRHELVARIAYMIYVQRGFAPWRHVEDWLAAEAIVTLCEEILAATAVTHDDPQPATAVTHDAPQPAGTVTQAPTPVDRETLAMELLEAAVADRGRKTVAGELGYKSPSTVGKVLRGDRPPHEALIGKILEAFGAARRRAA